MKTLSISLIIAVVAGLFVSQRETTAQPAPQVAAAVATFRPAPPDSAPVRPSPRLARRLDDREKDSLVGLTLLLALRRGAHSR
jgi:hypothetical protein